jgi:hypothetical protein
MPDILINPFVEMAGARKAAFSFGQAIITGELCINNLLSP